MKIKKATDTGIEEKEVSTEELKPVVTPEKARKVALNNISFSADFETYKDGDSRLVMVQFFGMSPNGPVIMSRVYKGTAPISSEEFSKTLAEKREAVITTSSQSDVMDALNCVNDILTEDMGYEVVPMYSMINLS